MKYALTPIHCRPWLLNSLSLKLIDAITSTMTTEHYGAVRLNLMRPG